MLFTSRLEPSPDLDSSGLGSRHPRNRGLESSSHLESARLKPARAAKRIEWTRADSSGIERNRAESSRQEPRAESSGLEQNRAESSRQEPRAESSGLERNRADLSGIERTRAESSGLEQTRAAKSLESARFCPILLDSTKSLKQNQADTSLLKSTCTAHCRFVYYVCFSWS